MEIADCDRRILDSLGSGTVLVLDRANELTLALARRNREAGGVNVFEPGYLSRGREIVEQLMGLVDLLKYSDELDWNGGQFRESPLARLPNIKLVIETRSRAGVRAIRGNHEVRLTTTPIMRVVDTAGAGDAFLAGFLTGMEESGLFALDEVSDVTLEDALERGQALGGLACLFVGSKGVLTASNRHSLEAAITATIQTRRPPNEFGSDRAPGGIPVDAGTSIHICPICRIPKRTAGAD
jgi:sugar/nucleoside kinase (ribokinase family)